MGDFLDTIVEKCETDLDSTKLVLTTSDSTAIMIANNTAIMITFELPIALKLGHGDVIQFYLGQYHITHREYGKGYIRDRAYITHEDYFRAEVRKGTKEPILFLNAKDMDILTRIKNYQERNVSEQQAKKTA